MNSVQRQIVIGTLLMVAGIVGVGVETSGGREAALGFLGGIIFAAGAVLAWTPAYDKERT